VGDNHLQQRLDKFKLIWTGDQPADIAWPREGLAIEGDFAGIQNYVLKPVPGARGAAKRLRARSFRVAECTKQIAGRICREFPRTSLFYAAGGRFLLTAAFEHEWQTKLAALQASLDQDLFAKFSGEVAFHLAAAPFSDGKVPKDELSEQHRKRRANPLEYALLSHNGWREDQFFAAAGQGWGKCPACLRTMSRFKRIDDQDICEDCADDRDLGTYLSRWQFPAGREPLLKRDELVHHFPRINDNPADFDDLAGQSAGKQWLGHLRIDADRMGEGFHKLEGNPSRIWGLSRMLQTFFCDHVQELIQHPSYRFIYPVYGGGDDLYVIGPWDHVLDLAVRLREDFRKLTAPENLTFSAGLALGKPHQHILTKSDEAAQALDRAKGKGTDELRDRICALGTVSDWKEFRKILRRAGDVLRWYRTGTIPAVMRRANPPADSGTRLATAFLQNILQLSRARGNVARGLWKPRLNYQIVRNVKKPEVYCQRWLSSLLAGGHEWRTAPTVVRYVLLAKEPDPKEPA
jgi:CRISPR-associated protein Csm1